MDRESMVESDRLDSWKAIAEFLGRDVATARRWEKAAGLPIRRVSDGSGRSVFAYRSEIDAWLKTKRSTTKSLSHSGVRESQDSSPPTQPTTPVADAIHPTRRHAIWRWLLATTAMALALALLVWHVRTSRAQDLRMSLRVQRHAVIGIDDRDGEERWRYSFPDGEQAAPAPDRAGAPEDTLTGENAGILAMTTNRFITADDSIRSGQLLVFSPAGKLRRTFSFEDQLTFGSGGYGPPWAMTDYRVSPSGGSDLIAIAAHHYQWWPALVTILDDRWNRRGTFVNAGWVEAVRWLSRDRLIISGFSNVRDGGMVALLDANAFDGQSPAPEGSPFRCASCSTGTPLQYVVLPRSEINHATVSPFNRALVELTGGRVVVRTLEVQGLEGPAVDALYEFSSSLELIRASYSDRYWETHRALERVGKIEHTREQCPDRDGPRTIEVWRPTSGWTTISGRPKE